MGGYVCVFLGGGEVGVSFFFFSLFSSIYRTLSPTIFFFFSLSLTHTHRYLPIVAKDLKAASLVGDSCRGDVGVAQPAFVILLARLVIGGALVAVGRTALKHFFFSFFAYLQRSGLSARVPKAQLLDTEGQVVPARRAYAVEIPARISTLVATSLLCVVAVPTVWRQLGLV